MANKNGRARVCASGELNWLAKGRGIMGVMDSSRRVPLASRSGVPDPNGTRRVGFNRLRSRAWSAASAGGNPAGEDGTGTP